MGNLYVRSTDGSDADNGTTWALAKATLTGVAAIDAAGDVIWVSQVHAESTAGGLTFNWAGTVAAPTRVLCGNDAAEPPTALATTAIVSATGDAGTITIVAGGFVYVYGITFRAGVGSALSADMVVNQVAVKSTFEQCQFSLKTTDANSRIILNQTSGAGRPTFRNCTFDFSATGQMISIAAGAAVIEGCTTVGSAVTTIFDPSTNNRIMVYNCDFSSCAAAMNIANATFSNVEILLRNCKLPASWSGSLNASTPGANAVYELHNCDSGDTNYRYQRKTQFGKIDSNTVSVRTGGASDGTTPFAWEMVSNFDVEWNHQTLNTGEIVRWNETVGSAITATIEILHDSVTNMTDQQIWLEVQYLGTSGFPLGVFIDDSSGDYLSTAADQTASSAAWNTTGMTNPNKQKLSVTFTPQEKGFIIAVVKLAKTNKPVIVDPKLEIT